LHRALCYSRISARPLVSTFRWPPESWGTQRYAGTLLRSDRDVLRDPVRPCASNLFRHQNALDSLSNPSVHSLSVTLGNHAVHDFQTYNWPCPDGHLPICGMTSATRTRGAAPSVQRVLSQHDVGIRSEDSLIRMSCR
jgi:hypothetical protein